MKKAASIFLRADIGPTDVRALANWMEDREVTRYLNEERGTAEQLRKLAASVPEPMLTYHFDTDSSTRTLRTERPANFNLLCGVRMTY